MRTAKVKQRGGGGGGMNLLPNDLMLEVLSRLPVKSLLRFRSVSKQFLCLISSPSLRKLHDHPHRTPNLYAMLQCRSQIIEPSGEWLMVLYIFGLADGKLHSKYDFPEPVGGQFWYNASSCNGLILFSSNWAKNVFVCNPSTHESVKLPAPTGSRGDSRIAMGFLHESNEYKILVWSFNGFEVCTLKDGGSSSWSFMNHQHNLTEYQPSNALRDFLSIDGMIYWTRHAPFVEPLLVLAFDLRTQGFAVICGPKYGGHGHTAAFIAELRGRLCIGESWAGGMTIWVQKGQNEWERRLEISEFFPYHVIAFVPATGAANQENHLRRVDGSQDQEDFDIVYHNQNQWCIGLDLHYYNIKNKSVTMRSGPSQVRYDITWPVNAFAYYDTLFSLNPLALQRE